MPADTALREPDTGLGDAGTLLVEEQRFSIVPEWVIDADLSDAAFRVYSLLLRYGNGSGCRMPSRRLLASRLHRSVDSVDRAMHELESAGIVRVEHRRRGRECLTNRYHVRTSDPSTPKPVDAGGGRRFAATPGRTDAATLAADLRPDRKKKTQRTPPPPPAPSPPTGNRILGIDPRLLTECGIDNMHELAQRCATARAAVGQPTGPRWEAPCLLAAIQLAVKVRGWPPDHVPAALLAVAGDRMTRSPMRLAEAGPWWDRTIDQHTYVDDQAQEHAEQRLDEVAGRRPALQAQARAELRAEGLPVTRNTVVQRAVQILDRDTERKPA